MCSIVSRRFEGTPDIAKWTCNVVMITRVQSQYIIKRYMVIGIHRGSSCLGFRDHEALSKVGGDFSSSDSKGTLSVVSTRRLCQANHDMKLTTHCNDQTIWSWNCVHQ